MEGNFDGRLDKSCDKITCPFNNCNSCSNTFGCMCHDVDFLKSNIDAFSGDKDAKFFQTITRENK